MHVVDTEFELLLQHNNICFFDRLVCKHHVIIIPIKKKKKKKSCYYNKSSTSAHWLVAIGPVRIRTRVQDWAIGQKPDPYNNHKIRCHSYINLVKVDEASHKVN